MDKDFSSVSTQYIICECGDNFPNESFLSVHLANGHGEVDTFLCDVCPEAFPSDKLLVQHKLTHKPETPKKPDLKSEKIPEKKKEKMEKKPPVIKVQALKKIDTISLIQNLKTYGRFIKLDPDPPETLPTVVEVEEPMQVLIKKEEAEADAGDSTEEIYYQCDVCNAIFYTEMDFNVHYQSEHALKQEPRTQTAEQILEEHLVMDHSDNVGVQAGVDTVYYYECEVCHKIFANEKYFNIHYNKVHGGLLPVAGQAGYTDHTQSDEPLSEGLGGAAQAYAAQEAAPKPPEQVVYYKCDLCKILYPSEKAYNTHFDKKHGASCQQLQTTGFRFIEQQLPEPYRPVTVTAAAAELFSCEFCPKSFSIKRSLQVHRKRVHAEQLRAAGAPAPARAPSRSKVCDVCGRAYNSNAALRYHQRRHTGEKPYACSVCPKRFTMPMFLQIHMRTHTGEKPYECPHCPKAFTNKAALIRHDRVHTGVKPYPCPECGKLFTQSNSMKLHVSTVHLKLPAPYKSKSRRRKSEARALQLALKGLPEPDTLILGE